LEALSAAQAEASKRMAELEEVHMAENKKYSSVQEEAEAKHRKLEKLENRLMELEREMENAYGDFQMVCLVCHNCVHFSLQAHL
jgi:hypothetical protein